MTSPQAIRILRERLYTTTPEPGVVRSMVAVTYQLPPLPPQVLFLEAVDRTDQELRQLILQHEAQRAAGRPREI